MTTNDRLELLRQRVEEYNRQSPTGKGGNARAALDLGYSDSAISQALSGKYKGNLDIMLTKVEEVYGCTTLDCPVLGEPITLGRCAEERRKLPRNTNPVARMLTQTCPVCDRRKP